MRAFTNETQKSIEIQKIPLYAVDLNPAKVVASMANIMEIDPSKNAHKGVAASTITKKGTLYE